MVKKLFKIFKILKSSKIIFRTPKKKFLIFDSNSIEDLEKYLFKEKDYFILETRYENITKIFLSPKIILLFILNLYLIYRKLLIQDIYLNAVIKAIRPKVVLTFIDNSIQFSKISEANKDKNIKFIALQNGSRLQWEEQEILYKKKLINKNINFDYFIPQFFCFGKIEKDHCKKYSIKVGKFTFVGNIRIANFLKELELKKIQIQKNKYDICLISDYGAWSNEYNGIRFDKVTQCEKGMIMLVKYTVKFCIENNFKFVFSFKTKPENPARKIEENWYKNNLTNNEYNFIKKHSLQHKEYSSYINSFQSKVIVANMSTLLRENISCGNKILACNLTNSSSFDFPTKGICSINNCDYYDFSKRLNYIIKIDSKNYFKRVKMKKNYLIHYNKPEKCFNAIRKNIYKYL